MPASPPSPAATGIYMPKGIDADQMLDYMRDKMNVTLAEGQDQLKGKVIRIAHVGYMGAFDVITAIAALETKPGRYSSCFWRTSEVKATLVYPAPPLLYWLFATVGDDLLGKAVRLAEKYETGIHVHVAEDPIDENECRRVHGKRVVQRYRDAGLLELKASIFSHCIHLDAEERRLLKIRPTFVVSSTQTEPPGELVIELLKFFNLFK